MSEQIKIERHYQAQAKQLVDFLFDKGYFADNLNRDGMDDVEGLLALYLQLGAESAARCGALSKKYKAIKGRQDGEDQPRHEEEMRWIARAREAETDLTDKLIRLDELTPWHNDIVKFLRDTLATTLVDVWEDPETGARISCGRSRTWG